MANNYNEYGYEDDSYDRRTGLIRKIIIIVLFVIAIILIFWLLKSCSRNKQNDKVKPVVYDYTSNLLSAGKTYFDRNVEERPKAIGECSVVELNTLINEGLLKGADFGRCNTNTTYVKTCILDNGVIHYTPWIKCTDKDSETEYDSLREGTISDIVTDKTYTQFMFMPQEVKKGSETLGKTEELWKDEITYESYKTLSTTKYYRYKDKLYTWNLVKKSYYTRGGDKASASSVNEYYTTSPKSGYTKKDSKTNDAYKWYTTDSKKEYYTVDGVKRPTMTAPEGYPEQDPKGITVVRYRSRKVTGTHKPTKYYVCSTSASSPYLKYTPNECSKEKEFTVLRDTKYSCANPDLGTESIIGNIVDKNATCYNYSEWSEPTATKCDTSNKNTCQSITLYFYYWYKVVGGTKTYYPSGSTNVNDEKVYYTKAPIKDAIKDTSTKTVAYKWYSESKKTTTEYTAVAPSGYSSATKNSDYKETEWSKWSTKNPKVKDGRDRTIETRIKIKLQQITGSTTDGWENLSTDYMSENEMINLLQSKKYNINTLEDISNNGVIRYEVKMYVRNKKESK